jgi:hypothetical protein
MKTVGHLVMDCVSVIKGGEMHRRVIETIRKDTLPNVESTLAYGE